MADDLILALALLFVIEGALYALFPDGMRRMLAHMTLLSSGALRTAGLIAAVTGVAIVWVMKR